MAAYLAIHAAIFALVLLCLVGRRGNVFWLAGFVAPLQGLVLYAGVSLTWSAFVTIVLAILATLIPSPKGRRMPGRVAVASFIIWATGVTVWFWLYDQHAIRLVDMARETIGWGPGQTTYRYVVQLGVLVLSFVGGNAMFRLVRSDRDLRRVINGFLAGNVVSVVAGLYQIVAQRFGFWWIRTSTETIALQGNFGRGEYASVDLPGLSKLTRLYGFGGEPKHTSAFIILALCVIVAFGVGRTEPVATWRLSLLFLVGLALTFSTSGWVVFAILTVVAFVWLFSTKLLQPVTSESPLHFPKQLVTPLILAALGVLFINSQTRQVIVEERLLSRLDNFITSARQFEQKEDALFRYLGDNPNAMTVGRGVGGVDFFLIPYAPAYVTNRTTLTPTYSIDRLIGDVGLVGLVLFLFILQTWWVTCRRGARSAQLYMLLAGIGILMLPYVAFPAFLLLTGAFLGATVGNPGFDPTGFTHYEGAARISGGRGASNWAFCEFRGNLIGNWRATMGSEMPE